VNIAIEFDESGDRFRYTGSGDRTVERPGGFPAKKFVHAYASATREILATDAEVCDAVKSGRWVNVRDLGTDHVDCGCGCGSTSSPEVETGESSPVAEFPEPQPIAPTVEPELSKPKARK
jgi:hypothetical protein